MQTGPRFEPGGYTHDFSHELVHAVIALAEVERVFTSGAFVARLPKRQGRREDGCGIGRFDGLCHSLNLRRTLEIEFNQARIWA